MPMRVIHVGRVTVQQSLTGELPLYKNGKRHIFLFRIPGRNGAQKALLYVLLGPEKSSIDPEELQKLIAAVIPKPHDGIDVFGIEIPQLHPAQSRVDRCMNALNPHERELYRTRHISLGAASGYRGQPSQRGT